MCDNRCNSSRMDDHMGLTYEFQLVLDRPTACMFPRIASCTDGHSSSIFRRAVCITDESLGPNTQCGWDAYIQ